MRKGLNHFSLEESKEDALTKICKNCCVGNRHFSLPKELIIISPSTMKTKFQLQSRNTEEKC